MPLPVRSLGALAAVLLVASFGCSEKKVSTALRPEQAHAIDRLLHSKMQSGKVPGLAAAVMRNGVVVKEVTLGVANLADHVPVTRSTPFQLASTTKTFTSTAVMLLVQDGRLALHTPIGGILEGLPASWRVVTVRQLLSHTSGLPDIVRTPGQLDLIAGSWDEAMPLIATAPMQFVPGEKWAYTQTNYALLGRIVERLSGQTLERFLEARLFKPLGMNETYFAGPARPCATNYSQDQSVRALEFPQFVHAAGGLCSSLRDLERWNAALDQGKIVGPDLARQMWTSTTLRNGSPVRIDGHTTGYGLGWVVDDLPGHKSVGHSGGNCTAYRRYVDDRLTIVVLHNGVLDPDGLVSSVAAIVQGGADDAEVPQELLWDAARDGDAEAIDRALAAGADIESLDTRRNRNGRRALNWAAAGDHTDAVRLLLDRGAAINAANKSGFTALHHAAESGAARVAAVLLAAGADRDLRNRSGERPADVARRKGHPDIASAIESRAAH